jgi:hypothetical protein
LGSLLDLETASDEALSSVKAELRKSGLGGFLLGAKDFLIDALSNDPAALQLIRAALSARFHDEAARQAYEVFFAQDVPRVFGSICILAEGLGMLKPGLRPEDVADIIVAALEQAFLRCYSDASLGRFDSMLGSMLKTIGAMAVP